MRLRTCSKCLRCSQRCDVRVTESEFKRLAVEKEKLCTSIKESQEAQSAAIRALKKALEELRIVRARKKQLQ